MQNCICRRTGSPAIRERNIRKRLSVAELIGCIDRWHISAKMGFVTVPSIKTTSKSAVRRVQILRRRGSFRPGQPNSRVKITATANKQDRVDVIFNPVSGAGNAGEQLEQIRSALSEGYKSVKVHKTTSDIRADQRAKEALEQGATVLVSSGGDGTVAAVAKTLRERPHDAKRVKLGIVPRGTANAMCAALGIPSDLKQAVDLVNDGNVRNVDVARVNDNGTMLMQCGVGLEAGTVKLAGRGLKDALGQFAYHLAAFMSLRKQETFSVSATLQGVEKERQVGQARLESEELKVENLKARAVTIANASPPLSVLAQGIGEVNCNDGLLEFVCVSPQGPLSIIRAVVSMFQAAVLRKKTKRPNVYGLRARSIDLKCDPPQNIVIDGEDAGMTPLQIDLGQGSTRTTLKIIAPRPATVKSKRKRVSYVVKVFLRLAQIAVVVALGILFFQNFRVRRA